MKIWLDDIRYPPDTFIWCHSVNEAKETIQRLEKEAGECTRLSIHGHFDIELIDCDHDLGDYARFGGDGIRLLDWLEETGRAYPIKIHSMNPVGVERMRAVIYRNGWREVR